VYSTHWVCKQFGSFKAVSYCWVRVRVRTDGWKITNDRSCANLPLVILYLSQPGVDKMHSVRLRLISASNNCRVKVRIWVRFRVRVRVRVRVGRLIQVA